MGFNDILDFYERFILFVGFYFGKILKILEKWSFFRADMAGLGKCHTGGYGRIGVYRAKRGCSKSSLLISSTQKVSKCM